MNNVVLRFKKRKIEKHLLTNGVGRGKLKIATTAPWMKSKTDSPSIKELKIDLNKLPKLTDELKRQYARKMQKHSEVITWKDNNGLIHHEHRGIGMSGADPIGEFIVSSVALGKPLLLLGKGIKTINNGLKSELNWSSSNWFGKTAGRGFKDGTPSEYNWFDRISLKYHTPEYWNIEANAKKKGNWLKMEDGSVWYGDPRSWVLMLSKNLKTYLPEDFWTGIHNIGDYQGISLVNPTYNGLLWGVYGLKFLSAAKARTYAPNDNLVFHMVSSKKSPTTIFDAKGKAWHNIEGETTNEFVNQAFSNGIKRVKIKNVSDTGPNKIKTNSKYSTGDFMSDWEILNSPGVTQNDIILAPNSFRKSLLGNNGNFKLNDNNIYR